MYRYPRLSERYYAFVETAKEGWKEGKEEEAAGRGAADLSSSSAKNFLFLLPLGHLHEYSSTQVFTQVVPSTQRRKRNGNIVSADVCLSLN